MALLYVVAAILTIQRDVLVVNWQVIHVSNLASGSRRYKESHVGYADRKSHLRSAFLRDIDSFAAVLQFEGA